jgi:hypothetical protein
MKPQFIRMEDGTLIALDWIKAMPPSGNKMGIAPYQSVTITANDRKTILDNIDIINDNKKGG